MSEVELLADIESGDVRKALISLAIENALLEVSNATLEEVGNRLYAKYHSYFMDCLEHPEYLNDILNQVFGPSHESIIKSIKKNLDAFADQKPIQNFSYPLDNYANCS